MTHQLHEKSGGKGVLKEQYMYRVEKGVVVNVREYSFRVAQDLLYLSRSKSSETLGVSFLTLKSNCFPCKQCLLPLDLGRITQGSFLAITLPLLWFAFFLTSWIQKLRAEV